jgi:hypothetical protein
MRWEAGSPDHPTTHAMPSFHSLLDRQIPPNEIFPAKEPSAIEKLESPAMARRHRNRLLPPCVAQRAPTARFMRIQRHAADSAQQRQRANRCAVWTARHGQQPSDWTPSEAGFLHSPQLRLSFRIWHHHPPHDSGPDPVIFNSTTPTILSARYAIGIREP